MKRGTVHDKQYKKSLGKGKIGIGFVLNCSRSGSR